MLDLAYLVDSQTDLAEMLVGMAQGEGQSVGAPVALRQTVSELVHLYSGLSETASEERFESLAMTLMELEPEARRTLTRDVLLPDLLQTGKSADVLKRLPDGEIVEAIRTLADLDVGGTGLVGLALERLDVGGDRQESLVESIQQTLPAPKPVSPPQGQPATPPSSSRIRLESDRTVLRDMRELAAHDLSVDAEAATELRLIRDSLGSVDEAAERLRVVLILLPHIRNPDRATEILGSVTHMLRPLIWERPEEAAARVGELLDVVKREALDPEIGMAIKEVIGKLLDANYIQFQAERWSEAGTADESVTKLLSALGHTATTAFLEALEQIDDRQIRRTILNFMCAHAEIFSESLYESLKDTRWTVVRNSVRVLGFAPPGGEAAVAKLLRHPEKRVIRETFLALSRIGTPRAAEEILGQLEASDPKRRELAEDAIRRFPAAEGEKLTGRLLSRPEFYRDRPQVARALIARFMSPPSPRGADLLRPLLGLRLQFWKPALFQLGWTASAALKVR
ncbi:MAG: HEAT repeat domain-containing protein [Gemmatimonadetes bacterium]|nr:HEAT repeat domain-containing protein [Gemmatimonadota bacterium]